MPKVTNGGVAIAYREAGEGDPVVLLMGLALPGAIWRHRMEELVGDGYRVVVPDSRGTGASDAPRPPYSMSVIAEDVVTVMDAISMPSALVAGVSFGGMVAQHIALDHPERVDGLALISTTCGWPTGRLPSWRAMWLLLKMTFWPDAATADEARALLAHPSSAERLRTFQERVDEVLTESPTPPSAIVGQLTAVLSHHTGGRLSEVTAPTRVITGDSDVLVPPENSEILADRIPNATLRVLPNAGHIAIHEYPDCLLDELEALRRS